MRLNQIIALVQGKKARAQKMLTELHHGWKDKTTGLSRVYSTQNEEGELYPSENKLVVVSVPTALRPVCKEMREFLNIVATQELSNTIAKADVVVGNEVVVRNVPVSLLLFLEKQLIDMRTLISNLPTLPEDKTWHWDEAKNCWVSEPEVTNKSQKVNEPIVKYHATPEHPAQTDMISRDKVVGQWTTIHLSGALPKTTKEKYLANVEALSDAVKVAREEANSIAIEMNDSLGEAFLSCIFKK